MTEAYHSTSIDGILSGNGVSFRGGGPPKDPFDLGQGVGVLLAVILSVIVTLIIVLNLATIVALLKFKTLRASVTNLLILYLSLADLMLAPSLMYSQMYQSLKLKVDARVNFLIGQSLSSLSFRLSGWTMTLIALDRMVAVSRPLAYSRICTHRRAHVVVMATWTVVTGLTLGTYFHGVMTADPMSLMIGSTEMILSGALYKVLIVPLLYAPLVLNTVLYTVIFLLLRKQAKKVAAMTSSVTTVSKEEQNRKRNRRLVKMMASVMVGMIISILPFSIVVMTVNLGDPRNPSWIGGIFMFGLILQSCNACMNPIIYCWQGKDWRKAYLALLCCKKNMNFEASRSRTTSK